jgi:BirA family biotin operon repressor/biotin-[acetyl-CoA-carboxylase] ligase
MTMLPAVAVVDAIRALAPGLDPRIKWVNDILLDGAKVAGVLTATQVTEGRFDLAVLGIGVNSAVAPDVPPTPFVPAVTSLSVSNEAALEAVLSALADRSKDLIANGPGGLLETYREASAVLGERVRVYPEGLAEDAPERDWPAPLATGTVLAIEDDLTLRIEGVSEPVSRGRLAFDSAF